MAFLQEPPRLGNQYDDDPLLQEYAARVLPGDVLRELEPELRELGELGGGALRELQAADRDREPRLVPWDAWGRRIDRIELTPLWETARRFAAERGLVAIAYERRHGELSRVHQFLANYLVQASLDVYSCPLAMADGAARNLLDLGNQELIARAVPRLTSRDPAAVWTSGQWMTERTGGSDVGASETVARRDAEGRWRLHGVKWFTSAASGEMTLTLARPEGNGPGGRGLALFYLEVRDAEGRANGIQLHRLKDKLGTRKVPTAELTLDGAIAVPVAGLADGVKNLSPMLSVTRAWNAGGAVWGMRRGLALARDYARRRRAFGDLLIDKPLHVDTLASLEAELAGAFVLTFRMLELLGRREAGVAGEREALLLRALTPIVKLTTARQAVQVASEVVEAFGGAGYVEDTGVPQILRDAQVLPIWEGTTNVLSLDTLRALKKDGTFEAIASEVRANLARVSDLRLKPAVEASAAALAHAAEWIAGALAEPRRLEAGARRFALTLGRTLELSLLAAHAQWCLSANRGPRSAAAARLLASAGVDRLAPVSLDDAVLMV